MIFPKLFVLHLLYCLFFRFGFHFDELFHVCPTTYSYTIGIHFSSLTVVGLMTLCGSTFPFLSTLKAKSTTCWLFLGLYFVILSMMRNINDKAPMTNTAVKKVLIHIKTVIVKNAVVVISSPPHRKAKRNTHSLLSFVVLPKR
jgi:hypothetical protein